MSSTAAEPRSPAAHHGQAIRLIVGDVILTGMISNDPAGRDFISLLPLTLKFSDYASTEKVSDLPRPLTITGSPAGVDPEAGDLTYYAPWGNLAIFYRDFRYAKGLVKLGSIDAGVDALAVIADGSSVVIELAS